MEALCGGLVTPAMGTGGSDTAGERQAFRVEPGLAPRPPDPSVVIASMESPKGPEITCKVFIFLF